MRPSVIGFCLLFLSIPFIANSQSWYLRSYIGSTYYQGDLAPLPINLSLAPGNLALAFSAGTKVTEHVSIKSNFLIGKISGDDNNASDDGRRLRNLSFQSSIYELGLTAEISINKWWKKLDKYGLNLYYTSGINLFHFNPHAYYNGDLVALKPLGTEGQGLSAAYEANRYELTQVNIPFGLGIRFKLNRRIDLGMEVVPRATFTDYLDDVSTSYVNYYDLLDCCGELTAALANRTGELNGNGPEIVPTGKQRGDKSDNDWYLFTGLYLSINFGLPQESDLPLIEEE